MAARRCHFRVDCSNQELLTLLPPPPLLVGALLPLKLLVEVDEVVVLEAFVAVEVVVEV